MLSKYRERQAEGKLDTGIYIILFPTLVNSGYSCFDLVLQS